MTASRALDMTTDDLVELLRETDPEPMRLRAENRELRRLLGALFIWIAEREHVLAFFDAEAARRWPSSDELADEILGAAEAA